jgi:predicted nucleic acid-binding protein
MALAKVNGLEVLFRLFPKVLTPPAVYFEVVTEGLRLGAPDAAILDLHYKNGALEVVAPKETVLPRTRLGRGEEESIHLAIESRADWLLIDDLDARQAALASFQSTGTATQIKGTLGIILSAHQDAGLPREQAIFLVNALSRRLDVWVSATLCRNVIEILNQEPE